MSTSAPENDPHALSGDQTRFIAELLGANARWSSAIHNAALDGQERASNEWAARYIQLVDDLGFMLAETMKWERDTELYNRLGEALDEQGWWPSSAREQLAAYRERLEKEKAERERAGE